MLSAGHNRSETQCADHIADLQKKYRSLDRLRSKTGAASVEEIREIREWPYWNMMVDLMKDDVSAHPAATMALGSSSCMTVWSQPDAVKPKSVTERKTVALESLAQSLAVKNELLKEWVQKKN